MISDEYVSYSGEAFAFTERVKCCCKTEAMKLINMEV